MATLRALVAPTLPLLLLSLLSGCVGDSGGAAKLHYDGSGNGTDSDNAKCDSDGTIVGSGTVNSGQVTVTVKDDRGATLFERTFDGGVNLASEGLDGDSGTWKLTAVRLPDSILGAEFSGEYDFNLSC